jgi:hypothetical protein
MKSVPPPAANGTITRTGFCGQVWANAMAGSIPITSINATRPVDRALIASSSRVAFADLPLRGSAPSAPRELYMDDAYARSAPLEPGLFDYNRLENR